MKQPGGLPEGLLQIKDTGPDAGGLERGSL